VPGLRRRERHAPKFEQPSQRGAAGKSPARRRDGRLVLLAAAGLALVSALVTFVLWPREGTGGAPSAWATLNTADVHALAFAPADSAHLYFGHHNGLLESRDGGRTWQPSALSGVDAMNVKIAEQESSQIAGHEVYLESTDAGGSWQPVPNDLPGLDLHAFALDPANPNHAWTFAVGFGLYETHDAGRHWALRQPGNWAYLATYRAADQTALIAVGPEGLVRSLDGGATWEPLAYPGAPLAGGIAAATDGSVLYAATIHGIRRSVDRGQSWIETGFDGTALAMAVAPEDPMLLAVVDKDTRFYRSPDGGASWPAP
jgi:photosystem II stability/assembly factor-like uncharacterized protein